jgi:hypothetical protein
MPHAPSGFQSRSVTASVRESPSAHVPIGDASDSTMQCNSRATSACLVKIRSHFTRVVSMRQHLHRVTTEHHVRDILRIPSGHARSNRRWFDDPKQQSCKSGLPSGSERTISAPFATFERPPAANKMNTHSSDDPCAECGGRQPRLKLHAARLSRGCREIRLYHRRHCLDHRRPCLPCPGGRRQSQSHRVRWPDVRRLARPEEVCLLRAPL